MTVNTIIYIAVGLYVVCIPVGMLIAIRLVRAGGRPARQSQLPTMPAPPPVPHEFVSGEWKAGGA